MNLDLAFYFAVFRRRWMYFALVFFVVFGGALTFALVTAPQYESEARLLLESSQIPDSLAAPTVRDAAIEKLQVLEQRLLTRANLLDIARKYDVFAEIEKLTPDEIYKGMRKATRTAISGGSDQATLMTLSFTARNGAISASVVNEYITLILAQDATLRTERAEDTLDFFKQETKRLSEKLAQISAEILFYQNENADALPDALQFRMTQLAQVQERLSTAEREEQLLTDQRARLIAIFNLSLNAGGTAGLPSTDEARQLSILRDQLAQARIIYSETNPRVQVLVAKVKQMEEVVRAQAESGATGDEIAPNATLQFQIADIDTNLAQAAALKQELSRQVATLKDAINRTPTVQVGLDALNREYENVQQEYNTAAASLAAASTGERIEVLAKGERIVVLEPATAPSLPTKPNRRKIAALGALGGIALGFGLIAVMEMMNRTARRPRDLVDAFGITPFATIPFISTPEEVQARRMMLASAVLVTALGLPAMLYAVHTFYLPLDLIVSKIATKFGIRL